MGELPTHGRAGCALITTSTLSELGPLGLALLLVALGVPVYVAFKARRHPLVPAAFGAYVACLIQTHI